MVLPELNFNQPLPDLSEAEREDFRELTVHMHKMIQDTERLRWAVETAPNNPHLWQHKYNGTPLKILIEHAKKSL